MILLFSLLWELPPLRVDTVKNYVLYRFEGCGYPGRPGVPVLPFQDLHLKPGGKVERIKWEVLEEEYLPGIPPPCVSPDGSTVPYGNYSPPPCSVLGNSHGYLDLRIFPFVLEDGKIKVRKKIKIDFEVRKERIRIKGKRKGGEWIKIGVLEKGVYRLDYEDIEKAGYNPEEVNPKSIRIFSGGARAINMSEVLYDTIFDFLPYTIPYYFHGDTDKIWEEGEYLYFYAEDLEGWGKNEITSSISLYKNPYADTNFYWLTWGHDDIEYPRIYSKPSNPRDFLFPDTVHFEQDSTCPSFSGLRFIWDNIMASPVAVFERKFKLVSPEPEGEIFISLHLETGSQYVLSFYLNDEKLGEDTVSSLSETVPLQFLLPCTNLREENTLRVELHNEGKILYFDYFEVYYTKHGKIEKEGFFRASAGGDVKIEGNGSLVFDVTDPFHALELSGVEYEHGVCFKMKEGRKYYVADGFKEPVGVRGGDPYSLFSGGADWVAITHPSLLNAVYELASWREEHLDTFSSPIVRVVTTEEIYNNFSGGIKDPSAIKRFVIWSQYNWNPSPSFYFLVGSGSFDYRNIFGSSPPSDLVPVHETGTLISENDLLSGNPCWDGWFTDLSGDSRADIPIGRLTASTPSEVMEWIEKLINYELSMGPWRFTAVILADDESEPPSSNTYMSEQISFALPEWMYRIKIYGEMYTWEGPEMNVARENIKRTLSRGCAWVSYMGHGNIEQLAHERLFLRADIGDLTNGAKCPFFYFGTCNAGYFDRPDERSLGDYSVLYPYGGAIASLAPTRATYASQNYSLGLRLAQLFSSKHTFGELCMEALRTSSGSYTYTLFGDPATPIHFHEISSIPAGSTHSGVLRLYGDGDIIVTSLPYDTSLGYIPVVLDGHPLFKGSMKDSISIHLPYGFKDSALVVYWYKGKSEIPVDTQNWYEDGTPPSLKIIYKGKELEDSAYIAPQGEIALVVEDESGVDLRNEKNISLSVGEETHFLAFDFRYEEGSSQKGWVSVPYTAPPGEKLTLWASAKDPAGNVGVIKRTVYVMEEEEFFEVLPYPNPSHGEITFYIRGNVDGMARFSIYTVAGRKIVDAIVSVNNGKGEFHWNGKDKLGRDVANGLYIWRCKAGHHVKFGRVVITR